MNKSFFSSWIFSSILMYGLSYFWHGVALNDLSRISYPVSQYLLLSSLAYLGIGFMIAAGLQFVDYGKKNYLKGLLIGLPLGVFIYLLAFVFGISFYANPQPLYILLDLSWQVTEQALGGLFAGFVYSFVYRAERILERKTN